jgi:polysaccharide biosynthesis protein PslF
VMANKAVEILTDIYGIERSKINFIPHGAPITPFYAEKMAKARFGLQGRRVISTFGLISPNKGIEDAIAAMPKVVEREPSAIYLVLGQTHPVVKRREGEWYRESLMKMVDDLGLNDHVHFVDHYLSLQKLIEYLLATDVYVTPYYANPHQITSGTLAYAIATGKVIVSTPYLYAEELLASGRGFLYPFRDVDVLSDTVANLLTNDVLFEETRRRAYAYGRSMTWPNVGMKYARLYTDLLHEGWVQDGAIRDTLSIMGMSEVETADNAWSKASFA